MAYSVIDDRQFCWEHALLRRMEDASRTTRELLNELIHRKDVVMPKDLLDRVKYQVGMLTYILEEAH